MVIVCDYYMKNYPSLPWLTTLDKSNNCEYWLLNCVTKNYLHKISAFRRHAKKKFKNPHTVRLSGTGCISNVMLKDSEKDKTYL